MSSVEDSKCVEVAAAQTVDAETTSVLKKRTLRDMEKESEESKGAASCVDKDFKSCNSSAITEKSFQTAMDQSILETAKKSENVFLDFNKAQTTLIKPSFNLGGGLNAAP